MSADQRATLAAQRAAETDPVQREAYALAERAGFDWYDTESSARRMAEHAAAELVSSTTALARISEIVTAMEVQEHYHKELNEQVRYWAGRLRAELAVVEGGKGKQ